MGYYDTDYLEHHGILGQKHGRRNGPPYPLDSGDHSSAEKKAASAAGIKVGSDSGKGSIENIKKSVGGSGGSSSSKTKKAPLTEEEKRLKAEEARLKGDSKNINKYMDKLTTDELRDAQTRAQIKKSLAEEKQSKADKEKKEAMLSGDKEKVKEYADKMSYYELQEAMNKVDLMAKLNRVPPEPTTMDKIDAAMKKVDTARDWMDKGLRAYDALAAINNTFNKEHQWPRAEFGGNKNDNKNDKNKFENVAKKIVTDAQNAHAQNEERDNKQSRSEKKAEARAERKVERAEEKEEKRASKKAEREESRAEERAEKKESEDNGGELKPTYNKYKPDYEETETNNRYTNWMERSLNDPSVDSKDVFSENRQLRMTSKEIDAELSANEQAMFKAISNPNSYDSNGNFKWDAYRPPEPDSDNGGIRTKVK